MSVHELTNIFVLCSARFRNSAPIQANFAVLSGYLSGLAVIKIDQCCAGLCARLELPVLYNFRKMIQFFTYSWHACRGMALSRRASMGFLNA